MNVRAQAETSRWTSSRSRRRGSISARGAHFCEIASAPPLALHSHTHTTGHRLIKSKRQLHTHRVCIYANTCAARACVPRAKRERMLIREISAARCAAAAGGGRYRGRRRYIAEAPKIVHPRCVCEGKGITVMACKSEREELLRGWVVR